MLTRAFLLDLAERAVSTAAQAALGVIGADGIGLLSTGVSGTLTAVGLATLVSVLKSLAAGTGFVGDKGSASLVGAPGRHEGPA